MFKLKHNDYTLIELTFLVHFCTLLIMNEQLRGSE